MDISVDVLINSRIRHRGDCARHRHRDNRFGRGVKSTNDIHPRPLCVVTFICCSLICAVYYGRMTNAAIHKRLAAMQADIRELKRSVKVNAVVEKARAHLREEILKGLESGPATEITPAFWKRM